MRQQIGFLVDTSRCVGCNACRVACQTHNETGPEVNWRQVTVYLQGTFPDVSRHTLSLACNHCAEPACMKVCPANAITKRADDGVVILDTDACNGCERCVPACPYGAPQKLPGRAKVSKCDFCTSQRAQGLPPRCVETCIGGALQFGPVDTFERRAGGRPLLREIEGFPDPSLTRPSTRFLAPGRPRRVDDEVLPEPAAAARAPTTEPGPSRWLFGAGAVAFAVAAGAVHAWARRKSAAVARAEGEPEAE